MTHISGHDRSQMFLLPESVDDYVGADNLVRFIDAFVDELDLVAAGFVRVEAKATGRPGYAPALRQKRGRYGSLLAALDRTGESQISLTDPDSRAMAAQGEQS
jgi:hypothetical protein